MPVVRQGRYMSEMTRRELVATAVGFTLAGLLIAGVVSYEWYQQGFSLFRLFGILITSLFLISVFRQFFQEFRRRRSHEN
jgi:hypothetical protein